MIIKNFSSDLFDSDEEESLGESSNRYTGFPFRERLLAGIRK